MRDSKILQQKSQKMSDIQHELIRILSEPTKKLKSNLSAILHQIANNNYPVIIETFKILHHFLKNTQSEDQEDKLSNGLSIKTKKSVQFSDDDLHDALLKMNSLFTLKCLISISCTPVVMEFIEVYLLPYMIEDALYDTRETQDKRGLGYFITKEKSFYQGPQLEKLESYGYNYVRLCTQLIKACSIVKPYRIICNQYTTDQSPFVEAFHRMHANLFHPPQEYLYIKEDPSALKKKFVDNLSKISEQQFEEYSDFIGKQFARHLKSGFKQNAKSPNNTASKEKIANLDIRKLMFNGNPLLTQCTLDFCELLFEEKKMVKYLYYALQYIDELLYSGNYEPVIFLHNTQTLQQIFQQVIKVSKVPSDFSQFLPKAKGKQKQKQALYQKFLSSLEFWANSMAKFSCKSNKQLSKIYKYYFVIKKQFLVDFPENQDLEVMLSEGNKNFQKKLSTAELLLAQVMGDLREDTEDSITTLFDEKAYKLQQDEHKKIEETIKINKMRMPSNQSQTSFPNKIDLSMDGKIQKVEEKLLAKEQSKEKQQILNLSQIIQQEGKNLDLSHRQSDILSVEKSNEDILVPITNTPRQVKLGSWAALSNKSEKVSESRKIIQNNFLAVNNISSFHSISRIDQKKQSPKQSQRKIKKKIDEDEVQFFTLQSKQNISINLNKFARLFNNQEQIEMSKLMNFQKRKSKNSTSKQSKQKNNKISRLSAQMLQDQVISESADRGKYHIELHQVTSNVRETNSQDFINSQPQSEIISITKNMPISDASPASNSNSYTDFKQPSILDSVVFVENKPAKYEFSRKTENILNQTAEIIVAPLNSQLNDSYYSSTSLLKKQSKVNKIPMKTFHQVINTCQNKSAQQNVRKYQKIFNLSQQCRSLLRPSEHSQSRLSQLGRLKKSFDKQNARSSFLKSQTWKTGRSSEHKSGYKQKERLIKLLENSKQKHEEDMKLFEAHRQNSLREALKRTNSLQKQKLHLSQLLKKKDEQIQRLRENSTNRNSQSQHNGNEGYLIKKLANRTSTPLFSQNRNSFNRPSSLRSKKQNAIRSIQLPNNVSFVNHLKFKRYFDNCGTEKCRKMLLKKKELLHKDSLVEVGCIGERSSNSEYRLTLFITPESKIIINRIQFVNDSGLNALDVKHGVITQYPIKINAKHQQRIQFLIKIEAIPFILPELQIQYTQANTKQQDCIKSLVPCPYHKFLKTQKIQFKSSTQKYHLLRSKQFPYSRKIFKNIDNLKEYLPNFEKIEENQIGEITYGGCIREGESEVLCKVIAKKNQFMYVEVGLPGEQPKLKEKMEFFVASLSYLFMKELN